LIREESLSDARAHDHASEVSHDEIDYDYSAKTRIMLLSLTDFCPYFCATADLDGKQFRHV